MAVKAFNKKACSHKPMPMTQKNHSLKGRLHLDRLNVFQNILLKTDGTLTQILEAYVSEPIQVVKLSQGIAKETSHIKALDTNAKQDAKQEVIQRKILLQGKLTGKNFLYADSLILPGRLDAKFRHDLFTSKIPIGKLWDLHQVETYKQIIDCFCEPAGQIAGHFKINAGDTLLCRTYKVFSNRKLIMLITEKFPEIFFRDNL